ncbi:hypothetical protein Y1Q_0014563 [Alligator mississippiensis]|uniref:Uncharacterized protein n=1 Tax=Alligator mississippiensis TaxID=8496 RepID=A0A151PDK2_ALLMI|nr:hypothetical protein Y1Q_0014563 [Alligator mississippiensis]
METCHFTPADYLAYSLNRSSRKHAFSLHVITSMEYREAKLRNYLNNPINKCNPGYRATREATTQLWIPG